MDNHPLSSILNPDILHDTRALAERFRSAAPFPSLVLDEILSPAFIARLHQEFPDFEQGNRIGDNGQLGGKSTTERFRNVGPAYRELDDAIQSQQFLQWLSDVTGIDDLLYDPWYLGGGTHESRNGVSLDPHVDFNYHPSERWHRRLNLLVYLNPTWEPQWGGCFELFRDPHASAHPDIAITPTFNRGVLFETSEHSWHGFNAIHLPAELAGKTRRSIALYFYTKNRPQAEVVDRHTTLYVKRQLPDRIAEGRTLDGADVAEILDLISQRDAHIVALYAENTSLRKAQDTGLAGNLLYLAKRAFVRLRR